MIEPLLAHVVPFVFVFARVLGLFVFSPILSSVSVPARAKVLMSVMLAVAVYPSIPVFYASEQITLFGLLPILISETLIGVCVGLIASIPIMMVQMGGHVTGFQMGLSVASVYNPELNTQSDVVGEVLFYLGLSLFFMLGGMEAIWATLLDTFERVPLGAMAISSVPLERYIDLAGAGFDMALRIAAPAMAMVFLVMVAMGFVMKTMPQINVMSVGFALKIIVGVLATAMSVQVIANVTGDEMSNIFDMLRQWSNGLGVGVGL